jgi:hypothetical protein
MLLTLGLITAPAVGVLGRAVGRQAARRAQHEQLDGVGDMRFHDRAVAARDAQMMRLVQHVAAVEAGRRVELPARKLDQQTERILEIDGVEDLTVSEAGVLDPSRVEPLQRLVEIGSADVEGDVMHAAGLRRRAAIEGLAVLIREHGDEPAIAGIEIDVAFLRVVEVRLLEDEGHPEHALPEVDRGLAIGPDQRDVMQPLRLQPFHRWPP